MSTMTSHGHPPTCPKGRELFKLSVAALGVVYGDIGTSPLYAIKESFHASHGLALNEANILGILSLVFWSLTLVVSLKYLAFILRADNHGEGGITALLALLMPRFDPIKRPRARLAVITLGLLGAGLLYGDGIITPAISVLSAVEGLEVATPAFEPFVVPITIAILVALFWVQKGGTAWLGAIFGPITAIWFATLVATGIPWIIRKPAILRGISPVYAVEFFLNNGYAGFLVLASVVLCITGGEALYADMGHFGRKPISRSWYCVVFPALMINYFGQGAVVLEKGHAALDHTFYSMVSGWMLYPLVLIATLATVIASQALISGAFSLTQQSVALGFFPRTTICHTSRETEGQIYVPRVNWLLMLACIAVVLGFRKSTHLAAAYGIAVTATMVITSILFFLVARHLWSWSFAKAGSIVALFLVIDLAFFAANATKIAHGGWIPVTIALVILAIMSTWKRGRQVLAESIARNAVTLDQFFARIERDQPHRVRGSAVFMTLSTDIAPSVLLHHYHHNRVLHERIILLSIQSSHRPEVSALERVRVTDLQYGFVKIIAKYGFMESPDVAEILDLASGTGLTMQRDDLSFYLGRETFVTTGASGMPLWRKKLFVLLSRNSRTAAEYFNLPPDRVIELGSQVLI